MPTNLNEEIVYTLARKRFRQAPDQTVDMVAREIFEKLVLHSSMNGAIDELDRAEQQMFHEILGWVAFARADWPFQSPTPASEARPECMWCGKPMAGPVVRIAAGRLRRRDHEFIESGGDDQWLGHRDCFLKRAKGELTADELAELSVKVSPRRGKKVGVTRTGTAAGEEKMDALRERMAKARARKEKRDRRKKDE